MGNVLRRNTVVRSLCIVNDIKPLSVTIEKQEWVYFAML